MGSSLTWREMSPSSSHLPLFIIVFSLFCSLTSARAMGVCKKVGAEELVDEAGCDLIIVRVNRCSGYCMSITYPDLLTGRTNGKTSCCRMIDTEWVKAELNCVNGPRKIRIPSAVSCLCMDCPSI